MPVRSVKARLPKRNPVMMAIKSGNETSLSDRTDVCSGRVEEINLKMPNHPD
jgi:hypothetical protein